MAVITRRFDLGKFGCRYVADVWLVMTAVCLFLILAFLLVDAEDGRNVINRFYAAILGALLVHGIAAWGVIRRRRWGYYLSLAISAYWVVMSGQGLINPGRTNRWGYLFFLVPGTIALAWLVTPAARSQFSPMMHNK